MNKLSKTAAIISSLACCVLLFGIVAASGCARKNPSNVIPFIPPAYFSSTLMMPFDLSNAYWSPYITRRDADRNFVGQMYVFKGFKVTEQMLSTVDKGYVWVDLVKAYPLSPANLEQLSVGEAIDVVGVMAGPGKDFANSLTFTGVVFLPAGFVQLPLGDASPFQYTPTY